MNKRIKQLANQVGLDTQHNGIVLTQNVNAAEAFEKFAELIVRECINEVHVADVGDLKAKGYYLDKVAEHLEKHFGVEE